MYAYIEGVVAESGLDHVILDNNGIGFYIQMSFGSGEDILRVGETARIYTYFQSNDSGISLYGFMTPDAKELFLKLISVNGLGPKGALSLLGTLSAEELLLAVMGEDEKTITKAPGIGAKMAKRIILDLKDKVSLDMERNLSLETVSVETKGGEINDAIMALTALGYSYTQSATAVRSIQNADALRAEDLVKAALKAL